MEVFLLLLVVASYAHFLSASRDARRRTDELEKSLTKLKGEVVRLRDEASRRTGAASASTAAAAAVSAATTSTPVRDTLARNAAARTARAARMAQDGAAEAVVPARQAAPPQPLAPRPAEPATVAPAPAAPAAPVAPAPVAPAPMPPAPAAPAPARPEAHPDRSDTAPEWIVAAKKWMFSGNLVAKLGLLILFIGVSFLLKYAVERNIVPIELRLAGIVLADIALLVWGWRIRDSRRGIGLPVQGAALGILMLVTFGAFRMYQLIPGGLAFGLLFALTFFTCLLAVLQNAFWLAVFGITGGFLAPIMTSTGQGSHIGLFSYYTLLNAGILGIALKRAWRSLNLIGFAFTFVIGTAWGVLRYTPENYLSTQLFLIVFVLFYVAIAIAYAARQAPALKNYVDATLVFGVPLVAFGLQYGMVKDTRFGVAFSALGLGLFYTTVALLMWRRGAQNFRLLVESFLSMGLVFGTLALPFALDGRWTSAAWALEGAGVVWVGLRQRQALTCAFGLLVQAGAWISFLMAIAGIGGGADAADANLWLGFLLLTGTAFLMAANFRSREADLPTPLPRGLAGAFLIVAAIWLVAGAWTEAVLRTSGGAQTTLMAASALVASMILALIAKRMQWPLARALALVVQAVAGAVLALLICVMLLFAFDPDANLFRTPFLAALLIFAGAMFSSWAMQRGPQPQQPTLSRIMLAWSAAWWFVPVLVLFCVWLTRNYQLIGGGYSRDTAMLYAYGVALSLSALAFAAAAKRLAWPALRWFSAAAWAGLAVATVWILAVLYGGDTVAFEAGVALACLWLTSEYMLKRWPASGWDIAAPWLQVLHTVRTAGPWLMIWPAASIAVSRWLFELDNADGLTLVNADWEISGSWARFIPAWLMMLVIVWLIARARADKWPAAPVASWHRATLLPLATGWSLMLAAVWNLTQNGAMAPLPYLPVLNPLDLTSGFAMALALACYRMRLHDARTDDDRALLARVPAVLAWAGYAWFNLMLLRTAAHYLHIRYNFDQMFASQFIQAMLSLVWSISALVLMWRAARRASRRQWVIGAVLLGVVVGKLFLIDLSNVGGVARIVSFVGVGLLMVVIGYIAPFPTQQETAPEAPAQ
ncbi:DUF2339 domain-containing protein [Massilia sp. CCM 8733]|uniref:DUF2339 domain-containing protein n=1 Tax=Massilia mucilaginosa TaxID=2609282 RepID=A0ABX0P1Z1_9BURK|nr:DUF2339 domain-containing protein [Massilia mucilaginosa]NHZ93058.1 DUF2339 domain-containing protein [Massilia mucilaginosa]